LYVGVVTTIVKIAMEYVPTVAIAAIAAVNAVPVPAAVSAATIYVQIAERVKIAIMPNYAIADIVILAFRVNHIAIAATGVPFAAVVSAAAVCLSAIVLFALTPMSIYAGIANGVTIVFWLLLMAAMEYVTTAVLAIYATVSVAAAVTTAARECVGIAAIVKIATV
jgi:hypothetical protein